MQKMFQALIKYTNTFTNLKFTPWYFLISQNWATTKDCHYILYGQFLL